MLNKTIRQYIQSLNASQAVIPGLNKAKDLQVTPDLEAVDENTLAIHRPKYEQRTLTDAQFKILDELTESANSQIKAAADEGQKYFDEFAAVERSEDDLLKEETRVKLRLKNRVSEIFKEHFDFAKYQALADSNPQKQKYAFLSHPLIQMAVKDSENMDFARTRSMSENYDFVLAMFKVDFAADLRFPQVGWVAIDRASVPPNLKHDASSGESSHSIVSIKTRASKALSDQRMVGLFPEAFLTQGRNDPNAKTRYFLDRFLYRTKNITQSILKPIAHAAEGARKQIRLVADNTFKTLKNMTDDAVREASKWWLTKHEVFHRSKKESPIPLVNTLATDPTKKRTQARTLDDIGFVLKSRFESFEELRVDLLSILNFADSNKDKKNLSEEFVKQIKEYVLSERILQYPIRNDLDDDFDSMVSQFILNRLVEAGAINRDLLYREHKLEIASEQALDKALNTIVKVEIKGMEQKIAESFNRAISSNEEGLRDLLNRLELNDDQFKAELSQKDVFKEAVNTMKYYLRYWANWHKHEREIDAKKIAEAKASDAEGNIYIKGPGDIERFKEESGGINAYDNIVAPELTKLAKPVRKPVELRTKSDFYKNVHPYITSLRNAHYYINNKKNIDAGKLDRAGLAA